MLRQQQRQQQQQQQPQQPVETVFIGDQRIVQLKDGTQIAMWKHSDMTEEAWREQEEFFRENPEEARHAAAFYRDSKAVKSLMMQREIASYYAKHVREGDQAMTSRLVSLTRNAELGHLYHDMKTGGNKTMMLHHSNEPMMMKLNKAFGGVPKDLRAQLQCIVDTPVTIQEACREGTMSAVVDYLDKCVAPLEEINAFDIRGVACLGYAIGANRIAVVKVLLERRADHNRCDSSGGTALHYAAAYGRPELLEFFIRAGCDVRAHNAQNLTPLALAIQNKQKETIAVLKYHGVQMF